MTDFPGIQAFVHVVDAGSFASAAQQMNMTPSGVSRAVSRLEGQLDVRLLQRSTRALSLTEEGRVFYRECARILSDVEAATESVGQARRRLTGKLRVAVASPIGRPWLIPRLDEFHARYPDIDLELNIRDSAVDMIDSNTDCAIRVGELTDSSLVARRIGQPRIVTCASPAYLERFGTPRSVGDLGEHRLIGCLLESTGRLKPWTFENGDGRYSMDVDAYLRINDAESVVHAAVQGLGITQTGDFVAAPHLQRGDLKVVLADTVTQGPPIWIVYPQRKLLTARAEAFIDWAVDLFGCATKLCSSFGVKQCPQQAGLDTAATVDAA